MKNSHTYTLKAIRKLLDLADRFLAYDRKELFRDSGDANGINALSHIIIRLKWRHKADDNEAAIRQAVALYNVSFRPKVEEENDDVIDLKEKGPEPLPIPVIPISVYEWASFYKYVFQNGVILDHSSLTVNAAWFILLEQLRGIGKGAINDENVNRYLFEFIGQLCLIGHEESAQVIHNYIHMATKVLEGQRAHGMTEISVGSMVLSVLLSGLDLSGLLVIAANEDQDTKLEAEKAEHLLIPKLTRLIIAEPIFKTVFDAKLYANLHQDQQLFAHKVAESEKLLWRDLPVLSVSLRETPDVMMQPEEQQVKKEKPGILLKMLQKLSLSERLLPPQSPRRDSPIESPKRERVSGSGSPAEHRVTKPILIPKANSTTGLPLSPKGSPGKGHSSPLGAPTISFAQDNTNNEQNYVPGFVGLPRRTTPPQKDERVTPKSAAKP